MMELLIYTGWVCLWVFPTAGLAWVIYKACIKLGILEELLDEDD